MPSSSGGGSHSGGSSGGGGCSSSGGGSHSGGSDGGSSIRTSSSYFDGAYRYVRYHDGVADYVYSSSKELTKPAPLLIRLILLAVYIPFLCAGVFFIKSAIHIPFAIKSPVDDVCIVDDVTDRFTNEEEREILDVLNDFKEKTGIPVCIMTAENYEWKDYYNDLSTYAYDLYVNRFDDEKHWLIVYSDDLSDRQDANNFNDWYFEGMKGDLTANILAPQVASKFNDDLTSQLMKQSNTTAEAFIKAFNNFIPIVMKPYVVSGNVTMAVIWNGFILLHMGIMFYGFVGQSIKYKNYVLCPLDGEKDASKQERRCDYCGGIYYKGTVLNCPHCGASVGFDG